LAEMDTKEVVALIARIRERANLLIVDEMKARGIEGIVPAHGAVLAFLFRQDSPVPIKAVVERVGRVKSTVTEMFNTLEQHGYIRKMPCKSDNRVTYVSLTGKGRAFRKVFDAISDKLLTTAYGQMPTRDRRVLMRLLSQVEQNLKAAGGGG